MDMHEWGQWALLMVSAFGAGVLNAVAGGGSFLTFPALVAAGIPPIAANATSALAVSPGYLGSTLGFRKELAAMDPRVLWREAAIAAAGGVAGALLLLVTPAKVFSGVVPWLLLFATALFALGPAIARWANAHRGGQGGQRGGSARGIGLLLVSVYGGYFNGGLGILLMALYTVVGESELSRVNALKNLCSLVLSLLSVATFVAGGLIAWPQGLAMMLACTLGGYWGAHWSRLLPAPWLRRGVIGIGLAMTVAFFLKQA
ncbi:sulfite exporter TauE/SafE family protein [Curvibacter sp. APW13]|uniref:sulfite exporter TauE/SafE family protein n=1 Tax=Curvibacter sp. APW13 TaxID=3077236 RepID=UPI0028E09F16|nr:sulfite exporter TauE/SafE family protein [Curvibacter sp. APW13]MDT8991524.1 sulfite exporter TauE/SafE family protein [Curvibacter sp. APW13]